MLAGGPVTSCATARGDSPRSVRTKPSADGDAGGDHLRKPTPFPGGPVLRPRRPGRRLPVPSRLRLAGLPAERVEGEPVPGDEQVQRLPRDAGEFGGVADVAPGLREHPAEVVDL